MKLRRAKHLISDFLEVRRHNVMIEEGQLHFLKVSEEVLGNQEPPVA